MGICDSSNNQNIEHSSNEYEKRCEQYKKLESSDLEKCSPKKPNSSLSINSDNIYNPDEMNKLNIRPQLEKYRASLEKKSEVSNMVPNRSEYSSKVTEEEIIIKGEINKDCQNKEIDFNNNSFKRLIRNNGGIIIKEDGQSNTQSNNNNELSKDNISEIYSQFSFGLNNKSLNSSFMGINGKNIKNKLPSESNRSKLTSHHSMRQSKIQLCKISNNDNRSIYSNKTIKHKINMNNYLNGVFNNNDKLMNKSVQYRYNNLLNSNNQRSMINALYNNKTNNNNNLYNNRSVYEKDSLLSNLNNVTNESTNEELMGSFISIPKNDERISESDLNYSNNNEDIISNLSLEK